VSGHGCPTEAEGTYRWSLTDGIWLSIEAISDTCPARSAYLDGEWVRGNCGIANRSCVGPLPAGRMEAGIFEPRGGADEALKARARAFSYEVPAGWAVADEWLNVYVIVPEAAFEQQLDDADRYWSDQIALRGRPVAGDLPDGEPCEPRLGEGVGTSIDDLAEWVVTRPGVVASTPAGIEIGGHRGLVIDADLAASPPLMCDSGWPGSALFHSATGFWRPEGVSWPPEGTWQDNWLFGTWGIGLGGLCETCTSDPVRIILLDLDGDPLLIWIDTEGGDPDRQAAFVEEAMPIVESFEFPS
jgi:hypothetical protein